MEAIKNALGFGATTTQTGVEPVSGKTGAGTATEPYDAGNAEGEIYFLPNVKTKGLGDVGRQRVII